MDEQKYAEIIGELKANTKEHESYNRRLSEHDEHLEKLDNTYILLERLTNTVNSLATSIVELKTAVQGVDKRVATLETEPADKWKKTSYEIIKYIVLAILGVIVGYFIKGA